MEHDKIVARLNFLSEVSNAIVKTGSQQEAISVSLRQIYGRLRVQMASLFLFSKDGDLHRVSTHGHDKNGRYIDDQWLPNERYNPGESFTGSAMPPTGTNSDTYGKPQYSNNITTQFPNLKYAEEYEDLLGDLSSGIAVPINGIHRTIGVLEVLNKSRGAAFKEADLYELILVSTTLANLLSNFTSQRRLESFNESVESILQMGTANELDAKNTTRVIENIMNVLISDLTAYKVAVLRLANESSLSVAQVLATKDIDLQKRENCPVSFGSGIAGSVFSNNKPLYLSEIDINSCSHTNREWIKSNGLASHACIPLTINTTTVGTLSVYTGYRHFFTSTNKSYLKSTSWLIASVLYMAKNKEKLITAQQRLDRQRSDFYKETYSQGFDARLDDLLHRFKDELNDISYNLNLALSRSKVDKDKIINDQIKLIDNRAREISSEFSTETHIAPISLNKVVHQCAEFFDLNNKAIEIEYSLDRELPLILFEETKLKIIIHNIISNAIDAIEKERPRLGQILIATKVTKAEGGEFVEVSISDNGCGIPNEIKESIFSKGFSTRKSENGTGLGLYLVKELVTSQGGKILFDSNVGKGTTWMIRFPLDWYKVA